MHRTSWMYIWCELSFDRTLFESWLVRIHSHMEWRKKENISICICSISMRFSIWTCGMMKNESSHSQQHTHILFFWMQLKMSSAHWTVHFNIICFQTLFVYAWWILWLAKIKVFYTSSLFSQVIAFTSLFARISPFLSSFIFLKKRVPKILLISQALNYVIDFIRVPGILMELCLFADFYVTCPPFRSEAGRKSVKKNTFHYIYKWNCLSSINHPKFRGRFWLR